MCAPEAWRRSACLAAVWRDCAAGIAYYVFHDGSIYSYPSPSIQDAVAVITSHIPWYSL